MFIYDTACTFATGYAVNHLLQSRIWWKSSAGRAAGHEMESRQDLAIKNSSQTNHTRRMHLERWWISLHIPYKTSKSSRGLSVKWAGYLRSGKQQTAYSEVQKQAPGRLGKARGLRFQEGRGGEKGKTPKTGRRPSKSITDLPRTLTVLGSEVRH